MEPGACSSFREIPVNKEKMPGRAYKAELKRFTAVGVAAAILDFSVFWVLIAIQVPRLAANVGGMFAGFVVGLLGHHRFTFQMKTALNWAIAVRYALGFAFNLLVGGLTLELFVAVGIEQMISKVLSMAVVVASNFLISRTFVFKNH